MARLFKRPNSPFWWADVRTPDDQRIRRSTACRDKSAAARIAREWERAGEHAAADALSGIERPSEITMIELSALYIAAMENERQPNYVLKLKEHLRVRILPYFGAETQAATITRAAVEGFRRALLSGTAPMVTKAVQAVPTAPMSVSTTNRHVITLRRLFDFGLRRGELRENAAANLPTLKERERERHRALTDVEIAALLAQLSTPHQHWLRFLVASGLRDDEAARLTWADLDTTRRRIRIIGSGAKSGKTRFVPLTREALTVLAELNPDGAAVGQVFGNYYRRKALANAWKRTSLPGRPPSAHDFRHTFASRALAAGLNAHQLRVIMGHESLATTDRYVHAYGDEWATVAAVLDKFEGRS